jgi:hypothetical protein
VERAVCEAANARACFFYNSGILKLTSRCDECIYRLENCGDIPYNDTSVD